MIQIFQDYGGIPILFVRYNPDKYQSKKSYIPNHEREIVLLNFIKGFKNRIESTNEWKIPLSACYLFYDNYEFPQIKEIKIF